MALTDALFTGTSGLRALGHGMSVIGDNVSNLNTTAFKGARITFSDVMAQSINTTAGSGQLGRGTSIQALYQQFIQGAFESTANPTDMAIAGNGFFIVRDPKTTGSVFFTRDGQFTIDKDGYLVNPQGLRVQGWKIDETTNDITGALTDIRINRTSPPVKTTLVSVITNLDARAERTVSLSSTNFSETAISGSNSLYSKWDASKKPPLDTGDYDYRTSLFIYDSLGTPHEITVYYKAVTYSMTSASTTTTENAYEFLITCDPKEDMRTDSSGSDLGTKKGIIGYGMLDFDTQGNVEKIFNVYRYGLSLTTSGTNTQYHYQLVRIIDENGRPVESSSLTSLDDFADPSVFKTTIGAIGDNNYPIFTADFLGISFKKSDGSVDTLATKNMQFIEFDLGYYYKDSAWRSESVRTTQYSAPYSTLFYDQNGFGPGNLESITVDNEGRITGVYSNGRVIPLWMVGLANFNAPEKLQKIGGNLFKETTHSGPPITGKPGTNGLGTIAPNSLEQSNVDLGEQFIKMILFQRGFQADSRIITVSDSMLEELINLKR